MAGDDAPSPAGEAAPLVLAIRAAAALAAGLAGKESWGARSPMLLVLPGLCAIHISNRAHRIHRVHSHQHSASAFEVQGHPHLSCCRKEGEIQN